MAKSLHSQAKTNNMTVNHMRKVVDRHKCCEEKLACCHSGYWYQVIQETKNRTRSKLREEQKGGGERTKEEEGRGSEKDKSWRK